MIGLTVRKARCKCKNSKKIPHILYKLTGLKANQKTYITVPSKFDLLRANKKVTKPKL